MLAMPFERWSAVERVAQLLELDVAPKVGIATLLPALNDPAI
jgi:hypothetical protein